MKVESNGFLRRSEDRADSSSTVSAGPRLGGTGPILESKLDVDAIVQVTDTKNMTVDSKAFTVNSANAFIATSPRLSPKHQVTLGRRLYDWSRFDDAWTFGAVSPRFVWDPIRPEPVGLTGVFYKFETKHTRVLAYGSPLSIPDSGYPLRNENGRLISSNPFFNPYFENVVIAKRNIPIRYDLQMPPMKDLVLHAGGMISVRHSSGENGRGVWAQALYGYMPVNQPNIAVSPKFVIQQDVVNVGIHPEIQHHHLAGVETGFTDKRMNVWGSAMLEKPNRRDIPSDWVAPTSERAFIGSLGGDFQVSPRWQLGASYLQVVEKSPETIDNGDFTIDLPGRFPYHKAARLGVGYQATDRMAYTAGFIEDFDKSSQLYSLDAIYTISQPQSALTLNLGSDFFASSTGKGYIGQYLGNDRVRGGVSYAF